MLRTLGNFRVQLEKDFRKRADDGDILAQEQIATLLDDWSVTLAFDAEDAEHWFREGNPKLNKEYDFKSNLSFLDNFLTSFI